MAITDIIEESEVIDAGAPSIKYKGDRPLKKEEMKMAGPDWYIKRIEHLMSNFDLDYEEAGKIADDSEKYYEYIGHDPYESRNMDEEVVEEGIMRAANGGVASQGGVKNYLGKQKMVTVPQDWKSAPDHPDTELAYITKREKDLLLKADLHDSLNGGPNRGPEGVMSLNGWGSSDPSQNRAGSSITSGMDSNPDDSGWSGTSAAQHGETKKSQSSGFLDVEAQKKIQEDKAKQWQKEAKATRRKMDDLKRQDALDINDPYDSRSGKRFSQMTAAEKAAFMKYEEEEYKKGPEYLDWKASEISAGDTKLPPGVKPNIKYDTGIGSITEKDDLGSGAVQDMFVNYPKTQDQPGIGWIKGLEPLLDAGAVRTRKFFSEPTKDIFGRDQKGVLAAGKFNYQGSPLTAERFAEMGLTERNKAYKDYMGQRMSGQVDAYGNLAPGLRRETIPHRKANGEIVYKEVIMGEQGGGGGDTYIPPIYNDPNNGGGSEEEVVEEEWEMPLAFRAEGGRVGRAYGGIMDKYTGRRAYGLGSIFKKAKKIFKSPLGKAALLGLGGWKAGLFGGSGGSSFLSKLGPMSGWFGKEGALSKIGLGKVAGTIGGVSLATALLSPPVDKDGDGYDDKTGFSVEEWRKKGAQGSQDVPLAFRAEGGDAESGLMNLGGMEKDYREDGGFVPIGKKERADDVPARLSKNEFVFTADAVKNAGDGDIDKGAEVMYNIMKNLEAGGDISQETQGLDGAREMFQTSQRLEEVL